MRCRHQEDGVWKGFNITALVQKTVLRIWSLVAVLCRLEDS